VRAATRMDGATIQQFLDVSTYAKEHGTLLRLYLHRDSGRPSRSRTAARQLDGLASLARGLTAVTGAVADLAVSCVHFEKAWKNGR
jgi:hypothetical protein